jgi:hypothetical protein
MAQTEYEEILRPSKLNWILVLLISAAFVAMGIFLVNGLHFKSQKA